MANKKGISTIQFLRGKESVIKQSEKVLLDGQPLYNLDTNELYIGDGVTKVKDLSPISAGEIINLRNGKGKNSLQQFFSENGIDYSAQANGTNSIAFGGKRYDMLTDADRTPTSAEGNQSFAAGGSTHAMADFATAFGKDGIAYQKGSFVAAMKGQAGKSEEDFNAYYWDALTNSPLHNGQGKKDGKITDEFGKTYNESYSTAATFGDGNKAKGYGDFATGAGNETEGVCNAAFGKSNYIESGSSCLVGGENSDITGDVGNSLVYGQNLKNNGRWNKTVLGQFNAPSRFNVFEFGAGTSDSNRKNAMEIKDDGAIVFGYGQSFKSGTRLQVSTADQKLLDVRNNGVTHIESVVSTRNESVGEDNTIEGKKISDPTQGNFKSLNTFMAGKGLQNNGRYNQTIVGQYNEYDVNALFQVGTGESDTNRKSGFEVLWNGRTKVKGRPTEDDDVVRLLELNTTKTNLQDQIDNKLDKTTENKIALKNNESIEYSTDAVANTIAQRTATGRIKVADAMVEADAVSYGQHNQLKDYTDTQLDLKLDKITTTTTFDRLYGVLKNGVQTMYNATAGANVYTVVYRDANGRAQINAPADAKDIVNKEYVDGGLDKKLDLTGGTLTGKLIIDNANVEITKTVDGDVGNLVVGGNLTVKGTTTTTEAETLAVKDNLIITNSTNATLSNLSGLAIKTGKTNSSGDDIAYGILYDPTSTADSVSLGLGSIKDNEFTFATDDDHNPIATRDQSSNLVANHLLTWNEAKHTLIDIKNLITNNKLSASSIVLDRLTYTSTDNLTIDCGLLA